MATANVPQKSKWDKIVDWYARQAYAVGMVYSIGAAVVIIGALFKIMHWPGAGIVLTAGMCTEALLFTIGIFEKPHATYHWEHVFPQLVGEETKELLGGNGIAGVPSVAQTAAPAESAAVPSLSEKDVESLKKGINDLAKTATQLSDLGKVATETTKLADQMSAAGEAAGKFVASANTLGEKSEALGQAYQNVTADIKSVSDNMQNVIEGTKTYQRQVEELGGKMGSLNSIYALQLNLMEAQNDQVKTNGEQIKAMAASMQKMNESAAETMKNHVAFEEGSKKLAAQVADLNKIYGNMLTALA